MNKFTKVYLTGLLIYALIVEIAIWVGTHRIKLDPFFVINGEVILTSGGFVLVIATIYGFAEGWWD